MKQLEKMILSAGIVVIAGLAVLALGWFARFWFSGCGEADASGISPLGLDLSCGTVALEEDTHGGFHGDGCAFTVMTFDAEDRKALEADMNGDCWHALPMTENVARAAQSLATGEDGKSLFPEITQGYYYFRDRHSQSTDPGDDSGLFSRASWNFTMAVYDSETGTLYYFALDT